MDATLRSIAQDCLNGAEAGTLNFPQVVGSLISAGFDGYLIDLRRASATYYLADGECVDLPTQRISAIVAQHFDADEVRSSVRRAQAGAPDYTYQGFCDQIAAAGCAGYLVSFTGRRVLYFGRTGETHEELFPPSF